MDYKLALQLKNAGFPQFLGERKVLENYFCEEGEEMIYKPTLSELIEACGNDFSTLIAPGIGHEEWVASAHDMPSNWNEDLSNLKRGLGKSAEEAVTNLWLALNAK